MTGLLVPVAVGWAVLFGPLAGWLARDLGRAVPLWVVFGAILGPIAAALLVVAPPARCPVCEATIRGWSAQCAFCGADARRVDDDLEAAPDRSPGTGARVGTGGPAAVPTTPDDTGRSPGTRVKPPAVTQPATSGFDPARSAPPGAAADQPSGATAGGSSTPGLARAQGDASSREILATGVFLGGDRGLLVGERYIITLHDEDVEILGPVTSSPQRVVLARPVAQLDVIGHGERVVITARRGGGRSFLLGFDRLAGADALAIERRLRARGASAAGPEPQIPEPR